MEITWITQGGFIFEHSGRRLVIDPYLSDVMEKTLNWTRLVPAPVRVEDLRDVYQREVEQHGRR